MIGSNGIQQQFWPLVDKLKESPEHGPSLFLAPTGNGFLSRFRSGLLAAVVPVSEPVRISTGTVIMSEGCVFGGGRCLAHKRSKLLFRSFRCWADKCISIVFAKLMTHPLIFFFGKSFAPIREKQLSPTIIYYVLTSRCWQKVLEISALLIWGSA